MVLNFGTGNKESLIRNIAKFINIIRKDKWLTKVLIRLQEIKKKETTVIMKGLLDKIKKENKSLKKSIDIFL